MTRYRLPSIIAALALALAPALALAAEAPQARNVILMISDGIGFNGWLAADYYDGRAGARPYQVARPDGTRPYVGASAHYALRLIGPDGEVLENDQFDAAHGVDEQYYDPRDRWTRLEGAFYNDFGKVSIPYTSYTDSAAAGTALHSGRKTSPGRVNLNWDGTESLQTIAHIAHEQGRATGAVTTVPVSHATPGSVWARVPHRDRYAVILAAVGYELMTEPELRTKAREEWKKRLDGRKLHDVLEGIDIVGTCVSPTKSSVNPRPCVFWASITNLPGTGDRNRSKSRVSSKSSKPKYWVASFVEIPPRALVNTSPC